MQGGWFAATAIGNYLVGQIGYFMQELNYGSSGVIILVCCLLSAAFMFQFLNALSCCKVLILQLIYS